MCSRVRAWGKSKECRQPPSDKTELRGTDYVDGAKEGKKRFPTCSGGETQIGGRHRGVDSAWGGSMLGRLVECTTLEKIGQELAKQSP